MIFFFFTKLGYIIFNANEQIYFLFLEIIKTEEDIPDELTDRDIIKKKKILVLVDE